MHAIEFEATAYQHTIRLPDSVPEGAHLRVLLLSQAPFVKPIDRNSKIILTSAEHISPLDPLDVSARVEELAELKNGWLDGKGLAPEKSALDWLVRSFAMNFDPDLPLPYLYPTAEGGVQAEWSLANWEVTLDINLQQKTAEYQALQLLNQRCDECVLNLAEQGDWQQLNASLKQLQEGMAA